MPKKKLTKAQVKRKLKTMMNMAYDLLIDKMGHPDSYVPLSINKILDTHTSLRTMFNRIK
jgi:hypothetical protein